MGNFVHLISTTNPNQLSQIKFALEKDGIEVKTKGESALGIGNVELTGISGADVLVHEDRLIASKKVLTKIGYELDKKGDDDKFYSGILYGMGLLAIVAIAYLIYTYING